MQRITLYVPSSDAETRSVQTASESPPDRDLATSGSHPQTIPVKVNRARGQWDSKGYLWSRVYPVAQLD